MSDAKDHSLAKVGLESKSNIDVVRVKFFIEKEISKVMEGKKTYCGEYMIPSFLT